MADIITIKSISDIDYAVSRGIDLTPCITGGKIDMDVLQGLVHMDKLETMVAEVHKRPIWQDSKGWRTHVPDKTKKEGRRVLKRKNKEDLLNALLEFYASGQDLDPTMEYFYQQWQNQRKEDGVNINTRQRDDSDWQRCCKDIAEKKLLEFTEKDLLAFYENLPKTGINTKTYSNIKTILKNVLYLAQRKNEAYVPYSVAEVFDKARKIKCKSSQKLEEDDVFSKEETDKIVNHLLENKNDLKKMGLLLLFLTGMRLGELVTLSAEDFKMEQDVPYIHINKTESRYSNEEMEKVEGSRQRKKGAQIRYIKDKPKTAAGDRAVPVPTGYEWLWERLKAADRVVKDYNADGEEIEVHAIFTTSGDWRLNTEPMRKALYKVCDELGIKRKSPHKIRKTYATMLVDSGMNEKAVTGLMGHVKIATTNQFYYRNRNSVPEKRNLVTEALSFAS